MGFDFVGIANDGMLTAARSSHLVRQEMDGDPDIHALCAMSSEG